MGESRPGGRVRDIPRDLRGAHPEFTGRNITGSQLPPGSVAVGILEQGEVVGIKEWEKDPSFIRVPKKVEISTGPITQDGTYTTGTTDKSVFWFDQSIPVVDGKHISRHGKLWVVQDDLILVEPPPELRMYSWIFTLKNYRLLPKHFRGAESAPRLPNFDKEIWSFE